MFSVIEKYIDKVYCEEKKQSHAAFLFSGKKIVSVGLNQYNRQSFRGKYVSSVHAEMNCLVKVF